MEFKGTKGKWELKKNEYGYNTSVFTDNSQNPNPFRTICVSRVNDQEQNNANLLLISKAPEMLEMLKDLCNVISCYEQQTASISNNKLKAEQLIKEATQI
jgi:hypothetical protein